MPGTMEIHQGGKVAVYGDQDPRFVCRRPQKRRIAGIGLLLPRDAHIVPSVWSQFAFSWRLA